MSVIDDTWKEVLYPIFQCDYYQNLIYKLDDEYQKYNVFPPKENLFRAFCLTKYNNVKVVILGQDPYHTPGVANGLAFSSNLNKLPSSLRNIYKELKNDLNIDRKTTDLSDWAQQGVLLLNTCLSVRCNEPNSHHYLGWDKFINDVLKILNDYYRPLVFILWGKQAQEKLSIITNKKHKIIISAHPSPLSAYNGFFGSKPFSQTNNFLKENHEKEINW